ncbi:MAG: TraM recognition domain-containing protein [Ardenticatenaceae bacterium]|nr:TraM recognition domain-containing protein [Ardenticatenaceae bacterium]
MSNPNPTATLSETKAQTQIVNILLPAQSKWDAKLAHQLMVGLFALTTPISLLIRAEAKRIIWGLEVATGAVETVTKTLYALYPRVHLIIIPKQQMDTASYRYPFGMGTPFVIPLKYAADFSVLNPLAAVAGAMVNLTLNEKIIYELTLTPVDPQIFKLGKQMLTRSAFNWWNFTTPESTIDALFTLTYGNHRRKRFAPALQKLVEEKVHSPLKAGQLSLKIQAPSQQRANFLATQFLSPMAAFTREGQNYLAPAGDKTYPLILSAPEAAALWQLPTSDCQAPGIQWAPQIDSPLPLVLAGQRGGVMLGTNSYQGKQYPVRLSYPDRVTHVMVVGKTRMGKTSLIFNMVRQDIAAGKGVAVIDPHGDLTNQILATSISRKRAQDVILFDTNDSEYAMGMNPLVAPPGVPQTVMAGLTLAVLRKIFAEQWSSTRMEDALYAALIALLVLPDATVMDIPRLFSDPSFRQSVLAQVTDPVALEFWRYEYEQSSIGMQRELSRPIRNRLRRFYRAAKIRRIICQNSSLDFRAILDGRKIFLANLSGLSEIENETLGALLISRIQMAAMSRATTSQSERTPFYLYIDEVQNFITTSLAKLYSEAGKYGLSLVVTNQFLKQLSGDTLDAILGNVGTTLMFRLGPQDGQALVPFVRPRFSQEDLINLNRFTTIVSMQHAGESLPAFNMETLPPIQPKADGQARIDILRRMSRHYHARPVSDIDAEITARYQQETQVIETAMSDDDEEDYFD